MPYYIIQHQLYSPLVILSKNICILSRSKSNSPQRILTRTIYLLSIAIMRQILLGTYTAVINNHLLVHAAFDVLCHAL